MARTPMLAVLLVVAMGCHNHEPPDIDARTQAMWDQIVEMSNWANGDVPPTVNRALVVAVRNAAALAALCDFLEVQAAAGKLGTVDPAGIQTACIDLGPGGSNPPAGKPPPFGFKYVDVYVASEPEGATVYFVPELEFGEEMLADSELLALYKIKGGKTNTSTTQLEQSYVVGFELGDSREIVRGVKVGVHDTVAVTFE